jgi:hypothetical protein
MKKENKPSNEETFGKYFAKFVQFPPPLLLLAV